MMGLLQDHQGCCVDRQLRQLPRAEAMMPAWRLHACPYLQLGLHHTCISITIPSIIISIYINICLSIYHLSSIQLYLPTCHLSSIYPSIMYHLSVYKLSMSIYSSIIYLPTFIYLLPIYPALSIHVSVYVSIIYLFIYLSSTYLSIYLSIIYLYLSIYLLIDRLSTCYLSTCLSSIFLSSIYSSIIYLLSIYLFISLPIIHLSISLYNLLIYNF